MLVSLSKYVSGIMSIPVRGEIRRPQTTVSDVPTSSQPVTVSDWFRERHPLVIQIKRNLLKLLNENNLRVTFFKVKAHNGMLGNEHADVLAKQATQLRTRIEYDAAPVSDVLREIKEDRIYRNFIELHTSISGYCKEFFPLFDTSISESITKAVNYYTTQFFTGHGAFAQYLHRFTLLSSPTGRFCNTGVDEDPLTYFLSLTSFTISGIGLQGLSFHSQRISRA